MRAEILAAVAAAATLLVLAGTVQGAGDEVVSAAGRAWHSVFPNRPKTAFGERMIVVLSSPSVGERTAASSSPPTAAEQREWVADIDDLRESLLAGLRDRGVDLRPELIFTHVVNGFSAVLDARAVAELERNPLVVGLYPVRAVYPAEIRASGGPGVAPGIALPAADGNGITVALLDTGVDRTHPALRARIGKGFDLVAGDRDAAAAASPDDPAGREAHGTRMASLVLRVAPEARIMPIRVVGWQRTDGTATVVGRGDRLIAGLERAVDPNGDGATADAVDIALAPVTEAFAAFTDSPEARAVEGATDLGTLVVAPSGNDGDAGLAFGSIAAPGGAPDALSVGAVDTRPSVLETHTRLEVGGDTILDEPARLLGGIGIGKALAVPVAPLLGPSLVDPGRAAGAEVGGSELGDFFDPDGVSRVAGRAALVPADGTSPARKAANAKAAGAAALLIYGTELPSGALDIEEAGALPVIALPADAGRTAADGVRSGADVAVLLAASRSVANGSAGRIAAFSSGGLAFDGRVRPDLVAPGVGLAAADVRPNRAGGALYATATGSSAAAAVTAGAAALVKEARPHLTARELRGALVGSASPLGEVVTRQGAGLLDVRAAARAKIVVEPTALAFGRAAGRNWSAAGTVTVTNASRRPLDIGFAFVADRPGAATLGFTAEPARLNLGPGASADVALGVSAPTGVGAGTSGVLLATAEGVRPARVPWAVGKRSADSGDLVGSLSLSNWEFEPSKAAPAVLAFRAGRIVDTGGGASIEPVGLLDVELWTAQGKKLGVIASLRDLLPGRYAFGLTGRDANGKILAPGLYVLRLRAQPVDAEEGTPPSTAQTVFRIKERS
jgi:hypothetical protein